MNTPNLERFTSDEILDEIVKREGPDGAVREYNKVTPNPVSSIDELRRRLSDPSGTIEQ